MNNYELVCIYRKEEDKYKAGEESVAEILKKFKAQIQKQEDIGIRDLAYDIKKQAQGRYAYYELGIDPAVMKDMDTQLRLELNLLKYMFVRK